MLCLQNGSQAPKMVQFVFGYDIVVFISNSSHYTIAVIRFKRIMKCNKTNCFVHLSRRSTQVS